MSLKDLIQRVEDPDLREELLISMEREGYPSRKVPDRVTPPKVAPRMHLDEVLAAIGGLPGVCSLDEFVADFREMRIQFLCRNREIVRDVGNLLNQLPAGVDKKINVTPLIERLGEGGASVEVILSW